MPAKSLRTGRDIEAAQQRFLQSLAAYIIFTYILGVGDRHLENVMLREDGALFHIDFGFVLGEEPTKAVREGSQFRLCSSQIAAMGGKDHPNYEIFTSLCERIFLCLRRHAAVLYTNLRDTCHVSLSEAEVQKHFDVRCGYSSGGAGGRQGGAQILGDAHARGMLKTALKSAEDAGNYYKINDMVHTLAKERGISGSISGGMEALGGWGKSLVQGVRAMVAEEGDQAAADGLARLVSSGGDLDAG